MAQIPKCELCGQYHQPEWFCVEWLEQASPDDIEKAWQQYLSVAWKLKEAATLAEKKAVLMDMVLAWQDGRDE